MTTLSQSSTLDLSIDSNGLLETVSDRQSYADIIADVIRTLKGEILLSPDDGIDYFGTVFKSVSRMNIWKFYVTSAVESLDFVTAIQSFSASYNTSTKTLTYSLIIETDVGSVSVSS